MLPVNVDQVSRKFAHKGDRHRLAIDLARCPSPFVFPRDDDLMILKRQILPLQLLLYLWILRAEHELHERIVCILRYIILKVSGSECDIHRTDHN